MSGKDTVNLHMGKYITIYRISQKCHITTELHKLTKRYIWHFEYWQTATYIEIINIWILAPKYTPHHMFNIKIRYTCFNG